MYNRALTATEVRDLYTLTDKVQGGDCVDTNYAVNPLAAEVCDLIDNNCNVLVDEKPDGSFRTFCENIFLDVPQNECEALEALYTGSDWTFDTNWFASGLIQSW